MGLFKYLCERFNCKSNCSFNNDIFDLELNKLCLCNFELKNKDIITIHKILNKRKLKINNNNNNNNNLSEV